MPPKRASKRKRELGLPIQGRASEPSRAPITIQDSSVATQCQGSHLSQLRADKVQTPQVVSSTQGRASQPSQDREFGIPVLQDLPQSDASLLTEVQLLGHYPRNLNGNSLETATAARRDERNLYKRLQQRKNKMDPQCLAFINSVKELGSVANAVAAASTSGQASQMALPHAGQHSSSGQASELAVPVVSQGSQCAIPTFPAHVSGAVYCFYCQGQKPTNDHTLP